MLAIEKIQVEMPRGFRDGRSGSCPTPDISYKYISYKYTVVTAREIIIRRRERERTREPLTEHSDIFSPKNRYKKVNMAVIDGF